MGPFWSDAPLAICGGPKARRKWASTAFINLLNARFGEWGLTAAERDIARLRQTSEGTVKAQTTAIYRKADVPRHPPLLSLFIKDLMGGASA